MPSRSACTIKAVHGGGGEPPTCFCGSAEYAYSFGRFPMAHVSRCRVCGLERRCELRITAAKPKPPTPPAPDYGFPPFWY